jgi:hypothetical protein
MIERYKTKSIFTWGGTRKYSKEIIKNNFKLYDETEWDDEHLLVRSNSVFTVEFICAGINDNFGDVGYIYEVKTTSDRIIGGISEKDFFKEYKNFEFLGYVNEEEYNEEML